MLWLENIQKLALNNNPFVIATITDLKGHSPRGIGSKMLITETDTYDSIGGGMLEHSATIEARKMLANNSPKVLELELQLNKNGTAYGTQCCGGKVDVLLELISNKRPSVSIFGAGHVAKELVKVLKILPIDINLIDSREDMLEPIQNDDQANINKIYSKDPIKEVNSLAKDSLILIMTHDHIQDFGILAQSLNRPFPYIGLIGSSVKWIEFQKRLKESGFSKTDIAKVTCPIGLENVKGKTPQAIAISTAGELLSYLNLEDTN